MVIGDIVVNLLMNAGQFRAIAATAASSLAAIGTQANVALQQAAATGTARGAITRIGGIAQTILRATGGVAVATVRAMGGSAGAIIGQIGSVSKAYGRMQKDIADGARAAAAGQRMLNAEMGKTSTTASAASAGLDKLAMKAAALGAAFYALRGAYRMLAEGAGLYAAAERTNATFEAMTGSVKQGAELFRRMEDFALRTSFSLNDVTTAAEGLLAVNIKAGDIESTLTMLGNLARGDTERLKRLAKAMTDVKAAGVLKAQDANQFTNAGVGIKEAIAMEKFGDASAASMRKVMDGMRAGQISYADTMAALRALTGEGGRMHGQLDANADKIGGLWQRLTEMWGFLKRDFVKALFEAFDVAVLLKKAIEWVEYFREAVKLIGPLAKSVAAMFQSGWVYALAAVTVAAIACWAGLLGPLSFILIAVAALTAGMLSYFGWTFKEIADWASWLVKAFTFAFNNIGPIAMLAGDVLTLEFMGAMEDIKHLFMVQMPEIWNWFSTNWKTIFKDLANFMLGFSQNLAHNMAVPFDKQQKKIAEFLINAKYKADDVWHSGDMGKTDAQMEKERLAREANRVQEIESLYEIPAQQFKGLTEGIGAPTTPALKLTERSLTDAEKALKASTDKQAAVLGEGFADFMSKKEAIKPEVELDKGGEDNSGGSKEKGDPKKFGGALERGSQDAYSAILAAMGGGDSLKVAQTQLVVERSMLTELRRLGRGNMGDGLTNVESFA